MYWVHFDLLDISKKHSKCWRTAQGLMAYFKLIEYVRTFRHFWHQNKTMIFIFNFSTIKHNISYSSTETHRTCGLSVLCVHILNPFCCMHPISTSWVHTQHQRSWIYWNWNSVSPRFAETGTKIQQYRQARGTRPSPLVWENVTIPKINISPEQCYSHSETLSKDEWDWCLNGKWVKLETVQ